MIGVDYSMSCPAMAVEFSDGIDIFYINANKKICTEFEFGGFRVRGIHYSPKDMQHSETQRYTTLASIFLPFVPDVEDDVAVFEAYAFGAKGRLTAIGENTGIFKAGLVSKGYRIETIAPNTVKKHAAESGKADKVQMGEAFFKEHGWHMHDQLGCKLGDGPAADVVDAYYVLKAYQSGLQA